jgi:hypothetical protein
MTGKFVLDVNYRMAQISTTAEDYNILKYIKNDTWQHTAQICLQDAPLLCHTPVASKIRKTALAMVICMI